LELVGCATLADRYPHELSGGQQQRIALARALVYEPSVVLFDEPLSNLDPTLREHLRSQIREIQRSVGFTGVYITHDQDEAFFIGDQVALLSHGEVIQFGRPAQIYMTPNTARVAQFVGATNASCGTISDDGRRFVSQEVGSLELSPRYQGRLSPGMSARLLIRPSSVRLRASGSQARLRDRVIMGGYEEFSLEFDGGTIWRVRTEIAAGHGAAPGDLVSVELDPDGVMIFRDDEA
jgi:ABC-type Fe3+/spermidine/putrescine transport system ATPase subunit